MLPFSKTFRKLPFRVEAHSGKGQYEKLQENPLKRSRVTSDRDLIPRDQRSEKKLLETR